MRAARICACVSSESSAKTSWSPLVELVAERACGVLVAVQAERVVGLDQDGVPERVVEVRVRVQDGNDLAATEPPDVVEQHPALDLARPSVDHQQSAGADDHADVDVMRRVARHEAPVADLEEPLVPQMSHSRTLVQSCQLAAGAC